jgi:hypothetical protein
LNVAIGSTSPHCQDRESRLNESSPQAQPFHALNLPFLADAASISSIQTVTNWRSGQRPDSNLTFVQLDKLTQ